MGGSFPYNTPEEIRKKDIKMCSFWYFDPMMFYLNGNVVKVKDLYTKKIFFTIMGFNSKGYKWGDPFCFFLPLFPFSFLLFCCV